MAHIVQVGAGSGGMVVLDLLARESRVKQITIIEPDIYKPHNAIRHYFPPGAAGLPKSELARNWLLAQRPDLEVHCLNVDLLSSSAQPQIESAVANADLGVCAVDNEPAKYHWDALMRKYRKAWTLGEVLSGGIGGFVHVFRPGGPCYGCVASFLKRSVEVDNSPPPDYSQPGGAVHEVTIPASKASITAIASWHALVTLELLENPDYDPGFTSLLITLRKVPQVFDEALKLYRFRIEQMRECLFCGEAAPTGAAEDLDVALAQALDRLAHA
ncbi:MAG: ThiF family adenylyltransferase [Gemmatales bacterium]|nr:ThiF family adenylyltransferase [Gemmatales bacterium]MCS7159383.1 ThiF family adenylyltransferase [Gemmatales bacterium]MDW8174582.1 ThiF family adenylyltransferase [Gemmatales bacterium]MDW8223465.1 ThiF family adenylyltransferase [Gemmatales bacterium]